MVKTGRGRSAYRSRREADEMYDSNNTPHPKHERGGQWAEGSAARAVGGHPRSIDRSRLSAHTRRFASLRASSPRRSRVRPRSSPLPLVFVHVSSVGGEV